MQSDLSPKVFDTLKYFKHLIELALSARSEGLAQLRLFNWFHYARQIQSSTAEYLNRFQILFEPRSECNPTIQCSHYYDIRDLCTKQS